MCSQETENKRKEIEGREEKQHVIMTSASLCYAFLPCGQTNEEKKMEKYFLALKSNNMKMKKKRRKIKNERESFLFFSVYRKICCWSIMFWDNDSLFFGGFFWLSTFTILRFSFLIFAQSLLRMGSQKMMMIVMLLWFHKDTHLSLSSFIFSFVQFEIKGSWVSCWRMLRF